MKRPPDRINQGIQGNVQAEVVAVGKSARATKTVQGAVDAAAFTAAIGDLRAAIAALPLSTVAHQTVERDVEALERTVEVSEKPPNKDTIKRILTGLTEKLKMVGLVVTEGVAVGEAIKKVAALVQIPLEALGIKL